MLKKYKMRSLKDKFEGGAEAVKKTRQKKGRKNKKLKVKAKTKKPKKKK